MIDIKRFYNFEYIKNFLDIKNFKEMNSNTNCIFPGYIERFYLNNIIYTVSFILGLNFDFYFRTFIWKTNLLNMTLTAIFIILNWTFYFYNNLRISFIRFFVYSSIFIGVLIGIIVHYQLTKKNRTFIQYLNNEIVNIRNTSLIISVFCNFHCLYSLILFGICQGIFVFSISCDRILNENQASKSRQLNEMESNKEVSISTNSAKNKNSDQNEQRNQNKSFKISGEVNFDSNNFEQVQQIEMVDIKMNNIDKDIK